MKKTTILLLALVALCGQFAEARGGYRRINKSLIQREIIKAELKTRGRILDELSSIQFPPRMQKALAYLQAKDAMLSHVQSKTLTETETEASVLYTQGDFDGAYRRLGFESEEVLIGLEELLRYVPNLSLNAFRWPTAPSTSDETLLEILRETIRRQKVLNNITANWPENAQRDYALQYLKTMDGLLNRHHINRLTEQDRQALYAYQDGDLQAAYQTLGFEWQEVINALESLEMHTLISRKNSRAAFDERDLFAWPVNITWKTKKNKK